MLTIVVLVAGASCATRSGGGGGVKSTLLLLHLPPPWQVWQPALKNSARPWSTLVWEMPPLPPDGLLPPAVSSAVVNTPFGVRTLKRIHSFMASSAGTAIVLPGSVT